LLCRIPVVDALNDVPSALRVGFSSSLVANCVDVLLPEPNETMYVPVAGSAGR
jgi:hypothetical protein